MATVHQSLKIIEVCTVSPPPESTEPMSLPFTFFDLLWLRFPPVQRLFFYQISPTHPPFLQTILPNLKYSLSSVLRYYSPLAGSVVWPQNSYKPVVEFLPGDGVLLTVAESDGDFHHLSSDGFRKATEYHPLLPQLTASDERVAVIALQVTLFPNVGFSIGIATHHGVLDGKTSTSFMKSWARFCSLDVTGGSSVPAIDPPVVYDRTVIVDSAGLDAIYANEWQDVEGPNNRSLKPWSRQETPPDFFRCTLELSRNHLHKLKNWVLSEGEKKNKNKSKNQENHKAFHLSSFTVATAFLCVCAAKSENLRDCKMQLVFSIDARSRIEPPAPENYFGNCLVSRGASLERNELMGENGMLVASKAISEAVKSLEEGALKGAESWVGLVKFAFAVVNEPSQKLVSIAGSPRFEVYSADFGWGKPRKVEIASIDDNGAFSFTDSRNGEGGIEIGLVRKRDEIERFAALFTEGLEALSNH